MRNSTNAQLHFKLPLIFITVRKLIKQAKISKNTFYIITNQAPNFRLMALQCFLVYNYGCLELELDIYVHTYICL